VERDVLDHRLPGAELDPQVVDVPRLRATASATRLTEIVRKAIRSAGAATAQGCNVMPPRFSAIISAQSARGGCRPSPRKFTEARIRIEAVSLMPASASTVPSTFGRISRRRIAPTRSPRATAASTYPCVETSCVAARTIRAIDGTWTVATPSTSTGMLRPAPVASTSRKRSGGTARRTSIARISSGSTSERV
jgi:hypothetical protein